MAHGALVLMRIRGSTGRRGEARQRYTVRGTALVQGRKVEGKGEGNVEGKWGAAARRGGAGCINRSLVVQD